ncbi:hypothetical protein GJ744_011633 [Endocarpon pusillum]|uniref:Uncharacterized protein n=1 Tax=Endocarpon pusillum TaxID=364733 RepID=A0A8H7AGC5_9EURO|nr:hypothetical protein GJ744_011633 [Endocarpon pusillum]
MGWEANELQSQQSCLLSLPLAFWNFAFSYTTLRDETLPRNIRLFCVLGSRNIHDPAALTFVEVRSQVTSSDCERPEGQPTALLWYLPKRTAAVHINVKMGALPYDDPRFLEPAHDHNPSDISYLTDIPPSSSSYMTDEVRDLLAAVQEATSIVFASFKRLDDLLSQRLERLMVLLEEDRKPGPRNVQYSEPAYFWYQNQVKNEVQYLITDAFPDWKHKTVRLERECCQCGIMIYPEVAQHGAETEFAKWFSTLKGEVTEWKRNTEAVVIPRFDQAVQDLNTLRERQEAPRKEPTQPGMRSNGEIVQKLEKVDSGVEF